MLYQRNRAFPAVGIYNSDFEALQEGDEEFSQ